MSNTVQNGTYWYRTLGYSITKVLVVKETEKSLVIRTFRGNDAHTDNTIRKSSIYDKYYQTFAEARASLIAKIEREKFSAQKRIVHLSEQQERLMRINDDE